MKKYLKKFFKTRKMFVCLLVSHIIIFFFMSLFLFWMYFESDNKIKANMSEFNMACVEHIGEIMDNFCLDLEKSAFHMKRTTLIDSAIHGIEDDIGYLESERALTNLWNLMDKYDFILGAYIYLPENNMVYSDNAIIDAETYFNQIYKYKNYNFKEWKNAYLTGINADRYFPVEEVDEYGAITTKVVTYSNSYLLKGSHQVAAYFNVLIDAEKLVDSIVGVQLLNNFKSFAVYDRNNNEVFKIGAETLENNLVEEHLNKKVKYADVDNMGIFYLSSGKKAWAYSIITDRASFLDEMSQFTMKFRFILLFNLITGLLMVLLSAAYNYRPFKKIIADITKNKADNGMDGNYEIGEVELLKTIFSEQKNTILKMEGVVVKQEKLIKERLLKNIIFAKPDDAENIEKESTNNLLLGFDAEMYGVVILFLHELRSSEIKNEMHLFEYAVSNMFFDVLKDNYNINMVGFKKGKIALIVNLDREKIDNWFSDLKFVGEYVNDLMIGEYGVELYVGGGDVYESVGEIPKSFEEAHKALNFRDCNKETNVNIYKELLEKDTQSRYYYYPSDADTEIISSVITGNYAQVKLILDDIEKTNDKLGIDYQARCRLNYELVVSYQNTAVACDAEPGYFAEDSIKGSTSDIIKIIKNQYRMLCGGVGMTKNDKSEKLVEKIRAYVCEHFFENSLSLDVISAYFGITRPYLSTLYRSVTGERLMDFITKVRIEEAKKLLKDRSLSINQIAVKVGFSSDISLIRAFKRVEGVTPGYYRDNL